MVCVGVCGGCVGDGVCGVLGVCAGGVRGVYVECVWSVCGCVCGVCGVCECGVCVGCVWSVCVGCVWDKSA